MYVDDSDFHAIYECGLALSIWEVSLLDPHVPQRCRNVVDGWESYFDEFWDADVDLLLTLC